MKIKFIIGVFFLMHTLSMFSQNKLVAYTYWFNDDTTNMQEVAFTPVTTHQLRTDFDVSALHDGANVLYIRYKDENGLYGSVLSKTFVKLPQPASSQNKLIAYTYWFNDDTANVQEVAFTPVTTHQLRADFDVSALHDGANVLHIRYKDENGLYGSVLNEIFVKQNIAISNNSIIAYRYWVGDDFSHSVEVALSNPAQQVMILDDFVVARVPKGNRTLYYQFADSMGLWSVVNQCDFYKNSLPVADFDYNMTVTCDSTVVDFIDCSVDGDSCFWDFGDSATSTERYPQHTYYSPGVYSVTQTVIDTTTFMDSTVVKTIHITGNSYAILDLVVCGNYISPSGKTYHASGTYMDTISNHLGCDSIITIDLTIKPLPDNGVTQKGIVLTANQTGATYQWLDCDDNFSEITHETERSFTPTKNGRYAVVVTLNGCSNASICHTVSTIGIVENTFNHDLVVYPNPTQGKINIDLGFSYENVSVKIQSLSGQIIKQKHYNNQQLLELDLDVAEGVYLLFIESKDVRAIWKIVKQ
ncbi:MAG: T9SS type A sorting domain-containing protein [Bacteroidales bacterium]|nr:T9SS type A sorting domain-containing protein [Bacteroidales bacterium]